MVTGTPMGLQEQWGHLQGRRLESAQEGRYAHFELLGRFDTYTLSAEGNPDEQKIGAFGVGMSKLSHVNDIFSWHDEAFTVFFQLRRNPS